MFATDHQRAMHRRQRLLIAGTVGLFVAVLALFRISLPSDALLAQFSQLTPIERVALLIRLLSPAISFLLAGCWVWVLLWMGSMMLSSRTKHPENVIQQERRIRYHLKQSTAHPQEVTTPATTSAPRIGQRERPIGVPPLFQLDLEQLHQLHQLPVTPLPAIHTEWTPNRSQQGEEEKPDEEVSSSIPQAEQSMPSGGANVPLEQKEEGQATTDAEKMGERFSLRQPGEPAEEDRLVTISLLKQVRVWVHALDGTTREVKLRSGENSIRLLILAYVVWKQGGHVDRDKMLTHVIARGKRRDMNSDQLSEVFDAAKKYLRQDLDKAVNEMKKTGHELNSEIDFFSNEPGFYWLHPSCRVVDLEEIEKHYQKILMARKDGLLDEKLDGSLPDWVVEACQKLIAAYSGDFLQGLIEKFPDEFGSWVREPFTLYRDRYLDALLILANCESALGRNFLDENLSLEQNEEQRRRHIARAAQLFYDYATYAINSTWDRKLKFAYRAGKDGERVIRAARAIRRCVVELGKLGQTDMVDQAYVTFKERMSALSEGNWKPDKDTENDVAEAKRTTSAYRFSFQIAAQQQESKE